VEGSCEHGNDFFLIGIERGGVQLGSLGTAATSTCQHRVIMRMEKFVE
jgi:hypothetical protein